MMFWKYLRIALILYMGQYNSIVAMYNCTKGMYVSIVQFLCMCQRHTYILQECKQNKSVLKIQKYSFNFILNISYVQIINKFDYMLKISLFSYQTNSTIFVHEQLVKLFLLPYIVNPITKNLYSFKSMLTTNK